MVARFGGGTHLALASYNAGEGAVARWVAERPLITREEFIDDIPYPETQNYVKRIVGTAEDYRRLYGQLGATGLSTGAKSAGAAAADLPRSRSKTTPQKATRKPASKKPVAKKPTRTRKLPPKPPTANTTGGLTRPTAQ
jgi:hypothetical protein